MGTEAAWPRCARLLGHVTGGTSFVLIIVSPDMVSCEATTLRLFAQNDAVASFARWWRSTG